MRRNTVDPKPITCFTVDRFYSFWNIIQPSASSRRLSIILYKERWRVIFNSFENDLDFLLSPEKVFDQCLGSLEYRTCSDTFLIVTRHFYYIATVNFFEIFLTNFETFVTSLPSVEEATNASFGIGFMTSASAYFFWESWALKSSTSSRSISTSKSCIKNVACGVQNSHW